MSEPDQWVAQQIIEAFPWETAPRYLLRDRDAIYGERFRHRVHSLLIEEVITAPRSPWQIRTWRGSSVVSDAIAWTT